MRLEGGSRRTKYDDGGAKEPDDSLLPYPAAFATCLGKRRKCPQVVFEVARSETLQELNEDMRDWLVKTSSYRRKHEGGTVEIEVLCKCLGFL